MPIAGCISYNLENIKRLCPFHPIKFLLHSEILVVLLLSQNHVVNTTLRQIRAAIIHIWVILRCYKIHRQILCRFFYRITDCDGDSLLLISLPIFLVVLWNWRNSRWSEQGRSISRSTNFHWDWRWSSKRCYCRRNGCENWIKKCYCHGNLY